MSQSPTRAAETSDDSRSAVAMPVIEEGERLPSQSQQPPAPVEPATAAADSATCVPAPCNAPSAADDAAAPATAGDDAAAVSEPVLEPAARAGGDAPSELVDGETPTECADGAAEVAAAVSDDQERPGGADAVNLDEREDGDDRAHEAAATPTMDGATAAVDSGADDAPSAKKHRAEAGSPRLAAAAEPAVGA